MAVFDSCESNKVTLDDTQPLICTIEAAEYNQGHTVYILKVQRGPFYEPSWQIQRRYSDFDGLNNILLCSGLDLPLPPKKVFGKLEREFIAERQQCLQTYINYVLSHPFLSAALTVKKFFDPGKYNFNFPESSLQHVSMVFRSETQWEVIEPLFELGWRIRKQFFLAKLRNDPKCFSVLSWMSFGPDKTLEDKDMTATVKLLAGIKHPFIVSPSFTSVSDKGVLVIYDFFEHGTLRDNLCKAKPKSKFLKKYGKPKSYETIENDKIRKFGRQILLTLKFLHERGLFCGHLHSGNIVIVNDLCKIIELESSVFGFPSFLRPYFSQLRKVQTTENIDIYCFGHVIYEMAFGMPFHQSSSDGFPSSCTPELRSVLEAILTTEACKKGLPSASDLLLHPFFINAVGITEEKIHFKVPSQLKEAIKKTKEKIESRLKEEWKAIRHQLRISKVHSQLSTEDEKKRKNERKKQQKAIQSSNENGLITSPTLSDNSLEVVTPVSDLSSPSTPNLLAPPLPPPPPPPPPPIQTPVVSDDRSALLNSIQGFNMGKLKKSETKDCSVPKL